MVDDLERERLALERERLRTERQKIAIELGLRRRPHHNLRATKDIWDKFGTFTTFTSSVVIGLAGVFATYAYNNRQLEIQHLEKDREQIRLENQEKISSKIELTKRLEAIFPYVSAMISRREHLVSPCLSRRVSNSWRSD
jgi:hypothetical protein